MSRPPFDLTLYLVVGRADCGERPLAEVVERAVAGGVTLVQLREKTAPSSEVARLASELLEVLRPRGVPLIVNDDIEATLASGAEGLHVGQEDLSPAEARRLLGHERILGLSVGSPAEAKGANPAVVDYVGIGPAYATPTKADAGAPLGPGGVAALRALTPTLPACAIGGIKAANAAEILAAGVDGIAVVSAIAGAADPKAAAAALRTALLRSRPG